MSDATGRNTIEFPALIGNTTSYAYQSDGRLTGVAREGRSSTYAYDGLGRQASATETTPHGSSTSTTVWNGAVPVQRSAPTATTALVTDALGELALQADVGDQSDPSVSDAAWSLLDRLGSTVAQSVGGSITQLATFDDWGTQSFDTMSWSAPVGFTGESTDPGYNLNTYAARTYDPSTGSWMSQDSWRGLLTQPQSASRYAYVTNSPTTLIDLSGNRPSDPSSVVQKRSVSTTPGRSTTPTADDHYAALEQALPSDYFYSGGGSEDGYVGGPATSDDCTRSDPCDRAESMSARHALNTRLGHFASNPVGGSRTNDPRCAAGEELWTSPYVDPVCITRDAYLEAKYNGCDYYCAQTWSTFAAAVLDLVPWALECWRLGECTPDPESAAAGYVSIEDWKRTEIVYWARILLDQPKYYPSTW